MDLLTKTGAIKLRSHLEKYLVGDEDRETVRQSRNGSSKRAIWLVEPCPKNPDAIKLKNLQSGLYLTASDTPFLLGMTGKRVVQLSIFDPTRVEWEPISDGFQVKFRSTKDNGKYLRGNGGTPPWRNSVTHDSPLTGGTYNWVLWDVENVSLTEVGSFSDVLSPLTSFNSVFSDEHDGSSSYPVSPMSVISASSSFSARKKSTAMDLFHNAKAVRLKSHHDKYLIAEDDEESVTQDRNGSTRNARWIVEFVGDRSIRLKSCYGKYLTATTHAFLLGMTGKRVQQTGQKPGPSVEWEPLKAGSQTRLRTRDGSYLRANGGLPPWRNSITHDLPHRTATQDWVLWDVDIVEILDHNVDGIGGKVEEPGLGRVGKQEKPSRVQVQVQAQVVHSESFGSESESGSVSVGSDRYQRQESSDSGTYSPPKPDGRLIYYHIADDYGDVNESVEGCSFMFKGHSVAELTHKLEEETGLEDIFVCTRSPLNGKLYPLRLQLPPNITTMHVVVVPSTSRLAEDFSKVGIL
ncbi:uncharacterized protein LOC141644210 [Silene latifolia]|uniref:uncharacterized protein LOC141644210 n=1 Tax=Silene latifolia TaxID=37657 RepID=UPI003D784692